MTAWITHTVAVIVALLSISMYRDGYPVRCAEDTCPVWVCDLMGDQRCASWREPHLTP